MVQVGSTKLFINFLKFLAGFGLLMLAITLVLNPIDQYIPAFSDILPLFKDISLFEYAKQNSSAVYFFIGGSVIFYVTYLAIFK